MFAEFKKVGVDAMLPRRALVLSFVLHLAIVGYLCWRPEPPIINRSAVLLGDSGSSIGLVYLPTDSSLRIPVNEESHRMKYAAAAKRRAAKRHRVAVHQTDEHPTEAKVQAPSMGSPNGDSDIGPVYGVGAFPALPVKFPDPHISSSDLPPGFAGDIVIEVTIDVAGNIVKKRVLQSVGHAIDEQVLAVLDNWRFRPATINGMPVASRQDVHFHFPS